MTDFADTGLIVGGAPVIKPKRLSPEEQAARIKKNYAVEWRFKMADLAMVWTALGLLALLLFTIVAQGHSAFWQTTITLPIELPQEEIDPGGTAGPSVLAKANYSGLINDTLNAMFPDVEERLAKRTLRGLISNGASLDLSEQVQKIPTW